MTPLLSVVIPTHNRAVYAQHAIRSLLDIPHPGLEVVVSDTSNDGELFSLVNETSNATLRDRRLVYFRPSDKLDMTGNHNSAISAATGEYVCLIGDDDTVVPDALVAAAWASSSRIEVIAPNIVANYAWPDFQSRHLGYGHSSRLYFSKKMGGASIHESAQALVVALRAAAQGTDGLPKVYHGIVKRTVLERLRERSGAYFHGSSPDVSGAIGLALCTNRFVVTDYPLTIPGASGGSNTGRSAMNKHKGKLNQESQTKAFETSGWSSGVPRFFSVETVWAHAAIETIKHLAPHHVQEFNFARLIAICRVLHSEFQEEIDRAASEVQQLVGTSASGLSEQIAAEVKRFKKARFSRVLKRLSTPTAAGGRAYTPNLDTIAATPAALAKHMASRGLDWEQVTATLTGCTSP